MTTRRAIALVALLALAPISYRIGRTDGHRAREADAYRTVHDTIVRTERVVEARLRVDTVRVRVAAAIADSARARFDSAATALEAAAETLPALPDTLVLPAITACRSTLAADSVHVAELRATARDALEAKALALRRADLADAHADTVEQRAAGDIRAARHRGWKEASVVASVVIGIMSFLK